MMVQMSRESLCASAHNYCELALLRCAPTLASCGELAKGAGDSAADFVAGTSNEWSDRPSCVNGGSAVYLRAWMVIRPGSFNIRRECWLAGVRY